jgi:integrase
MGKLTAQFVKHAGEGRHGDGRGLYLQVIGGSKIWTVRYQLRGRRRWLSLGSVEFVTLAQARERAFELRRKLKDQGIDPLEQRRAGLTAARIAGLKGAPTFAEVAAQYVEQRSVEWREGKAREKTRAEWLSSMSRYAFPIIGDLPVAAIDAPLVLRVFDPIWTAKPHAAQRLRERTELILEFARARGWREGDNPARWRELQHSLPKPEKFTHTRHHPALPYAELPALMGELRALPGVAAARALEFTILTAARTSEALLATWGEVDLDSRVWTVPAERMKGGKKGGKEHRVPLSDRALEILRELPRGGPDGPVFPGKAKGGFLNQDAMADVLAKLRSKEVATVHGFRSAFRDWVSECTSHPSEVVEMALAHAIASAVESAYRRGDLFEKRARLMADWERFCSAPQVAGRVVPLRATST